MQALNYDPSTSWSMEEMECDDDAVRTAFRERIAEKMFPCVAARAALSLGNIEILVASHLACPADDTRILRFLYDFTDHLRNEPAKYRSAAVVFRDASPMPETVFDRFMWNRLQALATLDRLRYSHDPRVSADPASPDFSFSLKEEAFFIIGLHASSGRQARQFEYPALVFNPHIQFDELRKQGKYNSIRESIRKRDVVYSGSVNPTLRDFGEQSEVFQYSGMPHESGWRCPLQHN